MQPLNSEADNNAIAAKLLTALIESINPPQVYDL
jgi:hypothetical protein